MNNDGSQLSRRSFTGGVMSALALATPLHAAVAPPLPAGLDATATVDPARARPFNRMIFGQFLEPFHRQVYGGAFDPGSPLADAAGFRLDVVEALRELRVPIVRWPGGSFVSGYHWQDGVGKTRTPAFNAPWGVEDSNIFGTDEFVQWCRLIGSEPYICTNAGTGSFEEMGNWVQYCNLREQGKFARMRKANGHADPFDVKYWSIGNENYFELETGSKSIAEWGVLVRESAKLMRAVDSRLTLLAAATVEGDWTAPLLQVAGKHLNFISIHGYWDALWELGSKPSSYIDCMMRSEQPERQIEKVVKLIADNGFAGKIKIAFDEWNLRSWHHPGFPGGGGDRTDLIAMRDENDANEVYTMADALFSASFLNGCLRHADVVEMACMSPVINVRGPLFVQPRGSVKRTTFHVLKMYSDLLQKNVVDTRVQPVRLASVKASVPQVDVVTTVSDDRRHLAIALVNRHPDRPARVRIDGIGLRGGRADVLQGDAPDAFNDVEHPTR